MKKVIDIEHSTVYDAINDVKNNGKMLSPELKEKYGNAEIRETYKISKVGTLLDVWLPLVKYKNSGVRLIRKELFFSLERSFLKDFKDDIKGR